MPLTLEQDRLVRSPQPHLYIEAGPGAGKTRVLAQRARYLLEAGRAPLGGLVALTFSRAMARDLREQVQGVLPSSWPCPACEGKGQAHGFSCGRCAGAGSWTGKPALVGTLHSLGLQFVRAALGGEAGTTLAGREAVLRSGLVTRPDFGVAAPEDVGDIVDAAFEEAGGKRTGKRKIGGFIAGGRAPDTTADALGRRILLDRGLATFPDILRLFALVAAERGEASLHERFPVVLLDEEQDLAPEAWAILDAWAPRELTAAGDDAQRVFSFFGASRREAPREGLGANHRSPSTLVDFGSRLRGALAAEGVCSPLSMTSARGPGGAAQVVRATWDAQALWCADLLFAYRPEQVAVLAPTHDLLDEAAAVLAHVGVQAARIERPRAVWTTHAGRAVLAVAQAAAQRVVAEWMVRQVARATAWPRPDVLVDAVAQSYRTTRPLGEVLGLPWASFDLAGVAAWAGDRARESRAFAPAADALAEWSAHNPDASAQAFLVAVASQETDRGTARPGVVTLATWHGAKGLEWDAVLVLGACEGSVPWARSPDDVAAWSRALYVACTRAREELLVVAPLDCRGAPREPLRPLVLAGLAPHPDGWTQATGTPLADIQAAAAKIRGLTPAPSPTREAPGTTKEDA